MTAPFFRNSRSWRMTSRITRARLWIRTGLPWPAEAKIRIRRRTVPADRMPPPYVSVFSLLDFMFSFYVMDYFIRLIYTTNQYRRQKKPVYKWSSQKKKSKSDYKCQAYKIASSEISMETTIPNITLVHLRNHKERCRSKSMYSKWSKRWYKLSPLKVYWNRLEL